jgi:hypothetical protein
MTASRNLWWLLGALALAGCGASEDVAGGSGTEAENALTVSARSQDGAAVAGAQVSAWPAGQVAALGGTAPTAHGITDAAGEARLILPAGEWSVLVRNGGTAYWRLCTGSGRIQDTLRPMANLTGTVVGGAGSLASLAGLGATVACDSVGNFHFDSLPSGALSLVVQQAGKRIATLVRLAPGASVQTTVPRDTIVPLASDTLVPTVGTSATISFASTRLGDSGNFAVAMRVQRIAVTDTAWVFSWGDGVTKGVRLGWVGSDTMLLAVQGRSLIAIQGIPLGLTSELVGLSWRDGALEVYLGTDLVTSLTTTVPTDRSQWGSFPIVGEKGISVVTGLFTKNGELSPDWFAFLTTK